MVFSRALFWTLAIRNLSVLLFLTQTKAILIECQYFHHMFDDKFFDGKVGKPEINNLFRRNKGHTIRVCTITLRT